MRAEISWAVYFLPSMSMDQLVPISRFTDRTVRSGLVMAWRLATSPTSTSPVLEKATTEGVVRCPSALGITVGSPASSTDTTELVVPRSMPTALGITGLQSVRFGDEGKTCHFPRIKLECDSIKSPRGRNIPGGSWVWT